MHKFSYNSCCFIEQGTHETAILIWVKCTDIREERNLKDFKVDLKLYLNM